MPLRARTALRALAVAGVLVTVISGAPPAGGAGPAAASGLSGTITVSAAASLTDAFTVIATKFERQNRRADVQLNFGSSGTLATQILAGAPADVYASADLTNMDRLVAGAKVTASPTIFARNRLAIAVKSGNPKGVKSLADLATVGIVSLCGGTAPCATYADQILARASVSIPTSRITRGQDVKATLTAVSAGDADAAIVYVTDVKAAGSAVQGVEIPESQNTVAVYALVPVAASAHSKLAKAFVAFVASPPAQRVLTKYQFLAL